MRLLADEEDSDRDRVADAVRLADNEREEDTEGVALPLTAIQEGVGVIEAS